jgi:hypothetical protein
MKWTIEIERSASTPGFVYETKGPGLGMAGFEPTTEQLAHIIGQTITQYLPKVNAESWREQLRS